jgi:hypothetical protein
VVVLLLSSNVALAEPWRGSVSGGWLVETNVKELLDSERGEDDALFRLLLDLQSPRLRLGRSAGISGRVRAGVDRYVRFVDESRWLAEGRLRGQWSLGRGRQVSFGASAFQQTYPDNRDRNFSRILGDLGYRVPLGTKWSLGVSMDLHSQDYRQSSWHDETGWGVRLSAARVLGSGITGEAYFRLGGDSFGRRSLKAVSYEDTTLYELGPDQKDSVRDLGVSFQRLRPFVARVGYTFSSRRSNSYGFSFRRHELSFLTSLALPWDMDVQALGKLQLTRHTDPEIEDVFVSPPGEDEEGREANNSLTLRVRRPLWNGPMAEVRCAWYRNESLLVGRFYTKWVLGAAVRWAFRRGE